MFCGVGLSALVGGRFVGSQIAGLPELTIPVLGNLPFVGAVLFRHDILVWASVPVAIAVWWTLFRTRWGLLLRAVGENPTAVFAAGRDPRVLQYQALFLAGLLGGIAGAHLSLALAKTWVEWMTAGRGFIAVALVIFSKWQPLRAIAGALLFGGAISLNLELQAIGVPISPFLLDMGERDVRSTAASTSASTEASVPSTTWSTIGSTADGDGTLAATPALPEAVGSSPRSPHSRPRRCAGSGRCPSYRPGWSWARRERPIASRS